MVQRISGTCRTCSRTRLRSDSESRRIRERGDAAYHAVLKSREAARVHFRSRDAKFRWGIAVSGCGLGSLGFQLQRTLFNGTANETFRSFLNDAADSVLPLPVKDN